jgi:hypothetical protein
LRRSPRRAGRCRCSPDLCSAACTTSTWQSSDPPSHRPPFKKTIREKSRASSTLISRLEGLSSPLRRKA